MADSKSKRAVITNSGPFGWIFFCAFIGAVVYFVQQSDGFLGFLGAILRAIFWPAYAVHGLLGFLQV